MNYFFSTQSIGLEGVINARELGGYVLPDGSRIKKGLLLRGGSLAGASQQDLGRLHNEFNVSHIFDFRTEGEVKHAPDQSVDEAKNVWLPAIDPNTEKASAAYLPKEAYRDLPTFIRGHADDPFVQDIARRLYTEMVGNEYTQLQYAAFLEIIATNNSGAEYWHCSQGKDRTGLGSAYLLAALGADRDLIMEDFLISNEFYMEELEQLSRILLAKGWGEAELEVARTFVGVNPNYFNLALDMIDKVYGGMDAYLTNQLLMKPEDRERLRSRFLE